MGTIGNDSGLLLLLELGAQYESVRLVGCIDAGYNEEFRSMCVTVTVSVPTADEVAEYLRTHPEALKRQQSPQWPDVVRNIMRQPDDDLGYALKRSLKLHEEAIALYGSQRTRCWQQRQRSRVYQQYKTVMRKREVPDGALV